MDTFIYIITGAWFIYYTLVNIWVWLHVSSFSMTFPGLAISAILSAAAIAVYFN